MGSKDFIKSKEKKYNLNELISPNLEDLQKNYPKIIESIANLGEVVSRSQDKVYITIDKAIEIFSEQLKDPDLVQEDRDKINNYINNMVDRAYQKDSEHKKFILHLVLLGITGIGGIGVGGAALTGKGPELKNVALKFLTKSK